MTFLEQIQANNDPNNPARIAARAALATMNRPRKAEKVILTGQIDSFGYPVKAIVDANGERWVEFTADI